MTPALNGAVMISPIAAPTEATAVLTRKAEVDELTRKNWLTMLNGTATAPAITPATRNVSARMPSTRQKPLRSSAKDLAIASKTGSRSSTISTGANNSTVYRYTSNARTTSTAGMPNTTAAAALPIAASTATSTATRPPRAATPAASSRARPSKGISRPRILVQVSPMVIDDPNTARPTMTVSIPDSSMPPSQLTRALALTDANHAPTTPEFSSWV